MAASSYAEFLKRLIYNYEGTKYTDGVTPYDPGGPTRYGITLGVARQYWKSNATAQDVKDMPIGIAIGIYKAKYWDALWGDKLPVGTDGVTVDYGVNSGISRAGKVLRRVLGLSDKKWQVDAEVLAALSKRDQKKVIDAISDERLRFMQGLKIWPTYKNGWTRRVNGERALAKAMVDKMPAEAVVIAAGMNELPALPKAMVPEPKTTKNVVKGSVPAAAAEEAARDGGNWFDWIVAHPLESAVCAALIVAAVFAIITLINRRWQAKQDAPTPGITVVPELPATA